MMYKNNKMPTDILSEKYVKRLKEITVGVEIKDIIVAPIARTDYRGENIKIFLNNDIEININGFISFNEK